MLVRASTGVGIAGAGGSDVHAVASLPDRPSTRDPSPAPASRRPSPVQRSPTQTRPGSHPVPVGRQGPPSWPSVMTTHSLRPGDDVRGLTSPSSAARDPPDDAPTSYVHLARATLECRAHEARQPNADPQRDDQPEVCHPHLHPRASLSPAAASANDVPATPSWPPGRARVCRQVPTALTYRSTILREILARITEGRSLRCASPRACVSERRRSHLVLSRRRASGSRTMLARGREDESEFSFRANGATGRCQKTAHRRPRERPRLRRIRLKLTRRRSPPRAVALLRGRHAA